MEYTVALAAFKAVKVNLDDFNAIAQANYARKKSELDFYEAFYTPANEDY